MKTDYYETRYNLGRKHSKISHGYEGVNLSGVPREIYDDNNILPPDNEEKTNGFKTKERAIEVLEVLKKNYKQYDGFGLVPRERMKEFGYFGGLSFDGKDTFYFKNFVNLDVVEFVEKVVEQERLKSFNVSFSVTGRTKHEQLAHRLANLVDKWDWSIEYNYGCHCKVR